MGGWVGLPGPSQPPGSIREPAHCRRRGDPPADLRAAARTAPQGEGGPGCQAGDGQHPQRGFQERAVSSGPAPPSSSPGRSRGAIDYISSLLGDSWGHGDRDSQVTPSGRSFSVIPGHSPHSLCPVFTALAVDIAHLYPVVSFFMQL